LDARFPYQTKKTNEDTYYEHIDVYYGRKLRPNIQKWALICTSMIDHDEKFPIIGNTISSRSLPSSNGSEIVFYA
jgi:hypothetical protein